MLQVVAEKTGYPVDMLELSMDLAGDLGVDSIKRVEILAAMREQAPNLPEVDPAELGKLRTLQEIVDRMAFLLATDADPRPGAAHAVDLLAGTGARLALASPMDMRRLISLISATLSPQRSSTCWMRRCRRRRPRVAKR